MPHVVLEGAVDLQRLCQGFGPVLERWGDDVLKIQGISDVRVVDIGRGWERHADAPGPGQVLKPSMKKVPKTSKD